ncbi:hypothetical protein HanHA300_Chr17g0645581 [Helianthus annuus]|nr:hypothetical protein HanHA300_Chr17g0645581 [Helianthus annuus]KAJ0446715.1 hypothetical protein HanHA89_Chr17g0697341 [Helianthus annuus]
MVCRNKARGEEAVSQIQSSTSNQTKMFTWRIHANEEELDMEGTLKHGVMVYPTGYKF